LIVIGVFILVHRSHLLSSAYIHVPGLKTDPGPRLRTG